MHRPRVAPNRRTLELPDGTPFFWLGDTAWELFHRLTREEATLFLENRAAKGFNVIQAVCLAELDGLRVPNPYGHLPLIDEDPTRPHEPYWEHVDWCVREAERLGLYVAMLPTWGDKINTTQWSAGPLVFTVDNARAYGRWVAERYRAFDNVIWVNGGDRQVGEFADTWDALARGLIEGDGGKTRLMTWHPYGGGSSSATWHGADWLDFNMMQSGHFNHSVRPDQMIDHDYALEPTKPVLDGEPRYENHPIFEDGSLPYYDEHDVRRAVYQSVFAGGCGVTYGCHSVWQMFDQGRDPINGPNGSWKECLNLPGAGQMRHLKALMLSVPFADLVPDTSLAVPKWKPLRAIRSRDGAHILVHVPAGAQPPIRLDLSALPGPWRAAWFDPRTGAETSFGELPAGPVELRQPTWAWRGTDWVLTLRPV